MGTVAIQTQCCLKADDEPEDSDSSTAQESTAVQVVDAMHWCQRPTSACAGKPVGSPATTLPRSPSEATILSPSEATIFVPP